MLPGIDVSHHKGKVSWAEVAQAGNQFAITKATEGTTFVDHRFAQNWSGIKAAGLIRGAFHYLRAQQDPRIQADHFLAQVQFEPGDLPPILDVEPINNKGATREQWLTGVLIWLEHVEHTIGCRPIIYTRANFWNSKLIPDFGDYPLWIAHYGVQEPTLPDGWSRWTFWQYTSTGRVPGVYDDVDQDFFAETPEQLRALTINPLLRVTSAGLNVRTSPTSETNDNLFPPPLVQGDVVKHVDASPDGKWFKVHIEKDGITREGWVAGRYLAPTGARPEAEVPSVEPPWMVIARREIGVREAPGSPDNPRIVEYLTTTTNLAPHQMQQDETDWCSAFVNWCMTQAGNVGTNHALARSWWNWAGGIQSNEPRYGSIVVFRRLTNGIDQGKGHVGFFIEREGDRIQVLGGNQGDAVSIKPRPASELIGYVHPFPLSTPSAPADEGAIEVLPDAGDIPFKRLPNGRLYEASLEERLNRIAQLEGRITDGEAESPDERLEIERQLDEARRDFAQAEARARERAPLPIPYASDAGPSPNWKAAWSWTTADRKGRYIVDPAAPFNDARIRNKPGEAQGANIERVVAFLDVEHTTRYKRQGDNTFCTVFVYDATWLLSAEVPIAPNRAANNMCAWLEGIQGQASGWRRLSSVDEAQELANQGLVVIATQRRPVAGHVAMVRPVPMDKHPLPGNVYTAQAGAVNSSLTTVADIFGNPDDVIFYMHA